MPISLASTSGSSMHGAVVPIAYASGGSANFGSIPQKYQDLYIAGQLRGINANTIEYGNITINGGSSCGYTYLIGDGSSASSNRNTPTGTTAMYLGLIPGGNAAANIYASYEIWILNYTNTTTYKTVLWRLASDTNGSGQTQVGVGTVLSTAAITSVNVYGSNGSASGTTHSLYGVRTIGQ